MVAVNVVSSDAPPASSIASPAAIACSRLPLETHGSIPSA